MFAWLFVTLALMLGLAILFLRQAFLIAVVEGISMLPTYNAGDRLLVFRYGLRRRIKTGSIVVLDSSKVDFSIFDETFDDFESENLPLADFGENPTEEEILTWAELNHMEEELKAIGKDQFVQSMMTIFASDSSDISTHHPLHIKRVIGLPGSVVRIKELDLLEGSLHPIGQNESDGGYKTWQVPAGHYFVAGDNRNFSMDSRSYGPIPISALRGVAIYQFSGGTSV